MNDFGAPVGRVAGEIDGALVKRFVLRNRTGITASILEYGAILETLLVPDASGSTANVVLGLPDLAAYAADPAYFGAVVGRFANRIEHGRFVLDNEVVQLTMNNPYSSIHGGPAGFHRKVWHGTPFASEEYIGVHLDSVSPDGEEGYPGTLHTRVTYELDNRTPNLSIRYAATTDRPTIVNLTNHSFFNLGGEQNPTILDHYISVDAAHYLPLTTTMLPTGDLSPVEGTPFDLRHPVLLADRLLSRPAELAPTRGFDHNYVLTTPGDRLRPAARLISKPTGRTMEVWTTEPAVDLYTGNYFNGSIKGVGPTPYGPWAGIAIETEHVSNSPNLPQFPSTVLRPGDRYRSVTQLRFSTQCPAPAPVPP